MGVRLLSPFLYALGTGILVPSSVLLYFTNQPYPDISIGGFITACCFLTIAAVIDVVKLFVPTHTTTEEETALLKEDGSPKDLSLFGVKTTTWAAIFSLFGGILFETASIMFWPSLPSKVATQGIYVFRVGSCCYLTSSALSLATMHWNKQLTTCSLVMSGIILFVVGALLYILGGAFSEDGYETNYFATAWLVGSLCFAAGAMLLLVSAVRT